MGLPAFKPSDRGLQKDLNQIKVGEIIAWGAHKGKIIKQFREVAGTRMENGVEVYNFVNLAGQVCMPDTPTIKLLELFGLTEENIAELCQTEQDHDLDEFYFNFMSNLGYTPDDWNAFIDIFADFLSTLTEIQLVSTPIEYNETGGAPKYSNEFGITNTTTDNEYANLVLGTPMDMDWVTTSTGREANPTRMLIFFTVKFIRNGQDVSDEFGVNAPIAAAAMLLMEGGNFLPEMEKTFMERESEGKFLIDQVENFGTTMNTTYMKDRYMAYTLPNEGVNENPNTTEPRVPGPDNGIYFPFYWSRAWYYQYGILHTEYFMDNIEEQTQGLFMLSEVSPLMPIVLMTVEGMQKSTYQNFGFWVSEFMNIHVHEKKPTGIKKILVGIMKAFLSLIDAIINFFLKIPVLKQVLEGIISILMRAFDLEYDSARGLLTQIIAVIIIIIISVFVPPMISTIGTIGAGTVAAGAAVGGVSVGTMMAIGNIASSVYQVYATAVKGAASYNAAEDSRDLAMKRMREMRDPKSAITNAFFGTLGSQKDHSRSDEMMYNYMFNPFDLMEQATQQAPMGETI